MSIFLCGVRHACPHYYIIECHIARAIVLASKQNDGCHSRLQMKHTLTGLHGDDLQLCFLNGVTGPGVMGVRQPLQQICHVLPVQLTRSTETLRLTQTPHRLLCLTERDTVMLNPLTCLNGVYPGAAKLGWAAPLDMQFDFEQQKACSKFNLINSDCSYLMCTA